MLSNRMVVRLYYSYFSCYQKNKGEYSNVFSSLIQLLLMCVSYKCTIEHNESGTVCVTKIIVIIIHTIHLPTSHFVSGEAFLWYRISMYWCLTQDHKFHYCVTKEIKKKCILKILSKCYTYYDRMNEKTKTWAGIICMCTLYLRLCIIQITKLIFWKSKRKNWSLKIDSLNAFLMGIGLVTET